MRNYPLSEKYDPAWIEQNWMGPNPLWLLEDLCGHLDLRPGMRVLDMGCGRGLTSVFLAREFGVTVFANDLWVPATENLRRFEEAGVADRVFPIHAEAHALPYAESFFDAAISIDSYEYYGTGDSYFPDVFSRLVKPGGQYGIVVPGLTREFEKGCPDTLKEIWVPEMFTFHSGGWWRALWEKTGLCEITACYDLEDSKGIWRPYADWCLANDKPELGGGDDLDLRMLEADTDNDIALIALTAKRIQC